MDLLFLLGLPLLLLSGLLLDGSTSSDSDDEDGEGPTDPETGRSRITGDDTDEELRGTTGAEDIYGLGGSDTILGLSGDDRLYGGAGADELRGMGGDDILRGGLESDSLYGGADNDLAYGGSGGDLLSGDLGNDTLYGDAGDDLIEGGAGNDSLYGGLGNDVLLGEDDDDLLDGGEDDDILLDGLGKDTLIGGTGDDVISTIGRETFEDPIDLVGDVSDGGEGEDFILFDPGFVEGGADTVTGGADEDFFSVYVPDADGADPVEPAVITDFSNTDNLRVLMETKTAGNELTYGTTEDGLSTLVLLDGIPVVQLQGFLELDQGRVVLEGETVTGYRIVGDDNANVLETSDAGGGFGLTPPEDIVEGRGGDDQISAFGGNSTLIGGAGDDTLIGGLGNDKLYGGLNDDVLVGSSSGGPNPGGIDNLYGGFGEDTLFLGPNDVATGDEGADEFVVLNGDGGAVITDFAPGTDILSYEYPFGDVPLVPTLSAASDGVQVFYGAEVVATLRGLAVTDIDIARDIRIVEEPASAA
ncbi:MAG: calcium-binding protein [Pseudorhodobacter sp.]|nr:calcium-binding protein [Pseudorhodobacter sp.]